MTRRRPGNSTNVRSQIAVARAALGVLGRASPPLAGRLALRLFTATTRHPPRPAEREVLASGRRLTVRLDGERLAAWSWGRGEQTVLLTHGWNGRGSQLHAFVAPLLHEGFRVVAFDNVGHGESSGSRATFVDLARGIAAVARAVDGAHAMIAHSLGGAATALALHEEGLVLERAVLVAAPTDPGRWIATFTSLLALDREVEATFREALARRVGPSRSELHVDQIAPGLQVPLLAIHDTDDREVPFSASVTLTRAWPGAELHATSGLGHQRILSDPDVIARSVRFVAEPHVHQGAAA